MIGNVSSLETPSRIEPCFLEEARGELLNLLTELPAAAATLKGRLHPKTAASLAELVRVMNCYYSNLIEGHKTRPRDIERALAGDFDADENRRNLQLEARAHIRIQRDIDSQFATSVLPDPASAAFLRRLHLEFYRDAPDAMLAIQGTHQSFVMEPGAFRNDSSQNVAVGRHIPPSGAAIEHFMRYFEERYAFGRLGAGDRILALAAAHHRFNYIHPFPDGNGRVSRLMTHAMALKAGIGAHGLWSVSRGLARGLESRAEYKSMLDHADMPRQGDLDGRGNLSHRALESFTIWFLKICLDQMTFMSSMFALDGLAQRLTTYAQRQGWRSEAGTLLVETLHRGEIARGDARTITGLKERTARDVLAQLIQARVLGSTTEKGPVSLRFPADSMDMLFPRLFPES